MGANLKWMLCLPDGEKFILLVGSFCNLFMSFSDMTTKAAKDVFGQKLRTSRVRDALSFWVNKRKDKHKCVLMCCNHVVNENNFNSMGPEKELLLRH